MRILLSKGDHTMELPVKNHTLVLTFDEVEAVVSEPVVVYLLSVVPKTHKLHGFLQEILKYVQVSHEECNA